MKHVNDPHLLDNILTKGFPTRFGKTIRTESINKFSKSGFGSKPIAVDKFGNDIGKIKSNFGSTGIMKVLSELSEKIEEKNYNKVPFKPCKLSTCIDCNEKKTSWPIKKLFNICYFHNCTYNNKNGKLKFGSTDEAIRLRDNVKTVKCHSGQKFSLWHPLIKNNCSLK